MNSVDRQVHLDHERLQVREAARRLLTGAPERSSGRHTVAALAAEARISRQRLYEHHADFLAEFRTAPGGRPAAANLQLLQQQLAGAQQRIQHLEDHCTALQERIRTLSAVITELTQEAQASGVVVAMPRRRHSSR